MSTGQRDSAKRFAVLAIVRDIDGRKNLWLTAAFTIEER